MTFNLIIALSTGLAALLLWMPRIARIRLWRAVITPLASIIGSGFLLLGPILNQGYGGYAPLVMAALCGGAYLFGNAIRFNIQALQENGNPASAIPLAGHIETLSSWALAFAYVISVCYYLNLLGAFALSLTPFNTPFYAKALTSAVFAVIVIVGWSKGFKSLEKMEYISVSLKLAIIVGLLAGLALHFGEQASAHELLFNPDRLHGWSAIATAFGLLITVQGFETSRYLGSEYSPQIRVRSMRIAQLVSTAIYLIYILLLSYVFRPDQMSATETGIINMMALVAPILPLMLVAAALASQFSAAIADTSGSGGLFTELSRQRIREPHAYLLLAVIGVGITWSADIFEIVSYASRAFAIYYALQSAYATVIARQQGRHPGRAILYGVLAILGMAIAIFGQPVE